MKHVSEGELQAYLDDALPAGDRAEVRGHLASCAACRGAYGVLRESAETFSRAVALLDGPVPATTAADVRERAESGAYVSYSAGGARRAWLRAAIVVLAFGGAGAVAALPGSPAREWVVALWETAVEWVSGDRGEQTPVPGMTAGQEPEAAAEPTPVGFAVEPSAGRVRILLRSLAPESEVRVRLVDSGLAAVRVTGGATTARFGTGPGRIEVTGGGNGEIVIELPRSARDAVIELDGRTLIAKEGGRLRFTSPDTNGYGQELRFRIGE